MSKKEQQRGCSRDKEYSVIKQTLLYDSMIESVRGPCYFVPKTNLISILPTDFNPTYCKSVWNSSMNPPDITVTKRETFVDPVISMASGSSSTRDTSIMAPAANPSPYGRT